MISHDVLLTFSRSMLSDARMPSSASVVCAAVDGALLYEDGGGSGGSGSGGGGNCSEGSYRFGSCEGDVTCLAYVRVRMASAVVLRGSVGEVAGRIDARLRSEGFYGGSPLGRLYSLEIERREPAYMIGVYVLLLILTMMLLVFVRDSRGRRSVPLAPLALASVPPPRTKNSIDDGR